MSITQKLLLFQDVLTPSAPGDYTPLSNTLTLTSSAPMANVSIAISSDTVVENDEQFSVVLSSSDPNVITPVNPAVVIIGNHDGMLPQSNISNHYTSQLIIRKILFNCKTIFFILSFTELLKQMKKLKVLQNLYTSKYI